MKVAFLSTGDPFDVHVQSGMPFHMRVNFEALGLKCHYIKPNRDLRAKVVEKGFHLRNRVGEFAGYSPRDFAREPAVLKAYAHSMERQIRDLHPDIVFSPSTLPVAFLDCPQPITFWTDCTFGGMINFYPEFTGLPSSVQKAGWATEDAALRNCTFSIFASSWAAGTAVKCHRARPDRTKVVLRSANVQPPAWSDLLPRIKARPQGRCQLFFMGVDWKRKGGPVAMQVAKLLNERGLPTELVVAGSTPELLEPHPPWLRSLGYISKSTPEGQAQIQALMQSSHFLIVPSMAECLGIASIEAAANGLPALVTRVGGVQEAVLDGINGMTFDVPVRPEEIAAYVLKMAADRRAYEALAESAYHDFQSRLAWPIIAGRLKQLMLEHL